MPERETHMANKTTAPTQNLVIAAGGGLLSLALGAPYIILFMYFAQLPLYLVGLSLGPREGIIACLVAFLGSLFVFGIPESGLYITFQILPVFLIVKGFLTQQKDSSGKLGWPTIGSTLTALILIGNLLLIGADLWFATLATGLETYIASIVEKTTALIPTPLPEGTISLLIAFIPGLVIVSWLWMSIINTLLAQSILSRFGKNLRPSPSITTLYLPPWMIWILLGSVLLAFMGGHIGYVGKNGILISLQAFFFIGLAVLHSLCQKWKLNVIVLIGFYLLMFLLGWPIILVAFMGILDHLMDFRQHIDAKRT